MMPITPKLKAAMDAINKAQGEGTIVILGRTQKYNVEFLSTGIKGLDDILGGGLPKSSIIELFGEPSAGKTTMSILIMAHVLKQGGTVAFIDAEHGIDERWTKRMGVNLEELPFSQPDSAEQALDTVVTLVREANVDLIVVDSVSALVPKEELEGVDEDGMGSKKVALQARLMAKAMRVLLAALKGRTGVVLFLNQFTTDIGAMGAFWGGPSKTKGGLALRQKSRVRIELIRIEWLKSETAKKAGVHQGRIGQKVEVRIAKSKVSPPFRKCELNLMFYTRKELEKMGVKGK
jgi:recombination protein RecA